MFGRLLTSPERRLRAALISLILLFAALPHADALAWKHSKKQKKDDIPASAQVSSELPNAPFNWEEAQAENPILKAFALETVFPEKEWWRNFNDPYLEEYIHQALAKNRDLKVAYMRVSQAQGLMGQTRALMFPTLDVQGRYSRQRIGGAAVSSNALPGGGTLTGGNLVNSATTAATGTPDSSFNLFSTPLVATYELDLWGKNRMRLKSAHMTVDQQTQLARAMALNLSAQVATAYLNLLRVDAQIATAQGLVDNAQQTMAIQQQLFDSGIISSDRLLVTAQDLAGYQQTLVQAKGQQGVFAHQLMILTGEPPITAENIKRSTLDALQFPASIPTGVPSELLLHRPDIIASEIAMKQAMVNVSVARREFFPTLNLVGSFGFAARELTNLFDWKSHTANLTSVLNQSLFAGGARVANLKIQKSVAKQQVENYQATLLRSFQQVEDSLSTLKADYGGYQQNLLAIQASEKAVALNDARYKSGISPRLDTLTARRQLLQFQQYAYQNKSTSLTDLVSLYTALGGGYTP